jgi:hypothetical protein
MGLCLSRRSLLVSEYIDWMQAAQIHISIDDNPLHPLSKAAHTCGEVPTTRPGPRPLQRSSGLSGPFPKLPSPLFNSHEATKLPHHEDGLGVDGRKGPLAISRDM